MSTELPDFTTAPAWQDGGGDVYVNLFCGLWDHRKDRAVDARELLVLTRAAELPDPSAEDFGGVGKRILAALEVES